MAKKRANDDKQRRKREQKQKRLTWHPPRLGHESMLAIPAFRAAAAALSESLRVPPGAPARLVSEDDLALPAVESMLHQRHSIVRQVYGWTPYLKGPDVAAIVEREYALGSVDP